MALAETKPKRSSITQQLPEKKVLGELEKLQANFRGLYGYYEHKYPPSSDIEKRRRKRIVNEASTMALGAGMARPG